MLIQLCITQFNFRFVDLYVAYSEVKFLWYRAAHIRWINYPQQTDDSGSQAYATASALWPDKGRAGVIHRRLQASLCL